MPKRTWGAPVYAALVLLFLYAPMGVMVLFALNKSNSTAVFTGFSLHWFGELLHNRNAQTALQNTLVLALLAATLAVLLGTVTALGMHRLRRKWVQGLYLSLCNLPLMNPEIVTGISLMLLFVGVGRWLGLQHTLGFSSLLLAHITFCLPYVVLTILPRLRQLDPHLEEAAQDLGCSPWGALLRVVLPAVATSLFSAFLMAFTISLDDFVVSNFASGPSFQTLPLYIYSMTKKRVKPDMYALSTLVFAAIFVLLFVSHWLQARTDPKPNPKPKGDPT